MRLLVCSAWEPEIEPLRTRLQLHGWVGTGACDEWVRPVDECGEASAEPLRIRLAVVGIGVVDAAARTGALLRCRERCDVSGAIFTGTVGTAVETVGVGDVVVASEIALLEPDAPSSQFPDPMVVRANVDAELRSIMAERGALPCRVGNTLAVTTSDQRAAVVGAVVAVEHLELFGFARACSLAGVRCGGVLGVANEVGSRGREQWREHHASSSTSAAALVYRAIADGALARWLASSVEVPSV